MDSMFLAAIRAQDTHVKNTEAQIEERRQSSQRRFKRTITDEDIRDVHRFYADRLSKPQIVRDTGLSTHTVHNILRRYVIKGKKIIKLDDEITLNGGNE